MTCQHNKNHRVEAKIACFKADPFELDHDCINPAGHQPVPSCGEVVCFHCARIIWS